MIDPRDVAGLKAGDRVTAISLWEPWASLMATGAKKIETRDWPPNLRGPLLICAAKRKVLRDLREDLEDDIFQKGLADLAPGRAVEIEDLNFGHAVALVNLVDLRRTEHLYRSISDDERYFGNYGRGRFGWRTSGLRRLRPFPVKGKQGLFQVRLPSGLEDWSELVAVNVVGPDDMIACPNYATADRIVEALEVHREQDPPCWGEVVRWPWTPNSHAEDLKKGSWRDYDPAR